MDRDQVIKIASDYAEQVRKVIDPSDIILFGSSAKGIANADSDIDMAVIFDKFDGDYWQVVQKLHELTIGIDTRIEPILLERQNDPSGFLDTIFRDGLRVS